MTTLTSSPFRRAALPLPTSRPGEPVRRPLRHRLARAVAWLYPDRSRTPAQSFWHDGDLPSVPYSALTSLSRTR